MANFDFVATPVRKPRRGGLLPVADVIEASSRLGMGVQWIEEGCDLPVVAPGLCWQVLEAPQEDDGDGGTRDAPKSGQGIEYGTADPFALYSGVECYLGGDDEDFATRAMAKLEAGEGHALEAIFHQTMLAPIEAETATSLLDAVGLAEQAAGAYPGLGVIHIDRRGATLLAESGYAKSNDDWVLHTAQGTPIANGSGYPLAIGEAPVEIILTGQVTIWRGPITVNFTREPLTNRTLAIAERAYAASYDCLARKFQITS